MSWRMARSLDVLLAEINAAAPNRNKASDGGIGDAAHANRSSDHNPWVKVGNLGIVRARDFTHDPARGMDCNDLARRLEAMLRAGKHPALGSGAYIIWNRRILSRNRLSEGWRRYTGGNPHTKHLHLSVATARSGFDDTRKWGLYAPPVGNVTQPGRPTQPIKKEEVVTKPKDLWDHEVKEVDGGTEKETAPTWLLLAQAHARAGRTERNVRALRQEVAGLAKALEALAAGVGPAVEAAVHKAITESAVSVDVTLNVDETRSE